MLGVNMGSLRGAGMVVLQMMRAFSVITLAAVAVSCWVLIIDVDKKRNYFVFECAAHFFRFILCLVLIVSEFPVASPVKGYFRRNWPLISDQHGLVWLGILMVVIGCDMFGNLNRPAYDPEKLGPHFSKLVVAASVLALVFGLLNVVCSLVWRDGSDGITCRDIRSNGSLADGNRQSLPDYSSATHSNMSSSSARNEKSRSAFVSMFWKRGKAADKIKPTISGPMPVHDPERQQHADDRLSPIVPGLKRPNTALHPMHANRSSMYSEAHMSRF